MTCGGCGLPGVQYRAPEVNGAFCNMACVETVLFGHGRCRWCGSDMSAKVYTSIESRLCSEECNSNYWSRVCGERNAALGTGKRFIAWLQRNHPRGYRDFVGDSVLTGNCANPNCKRGDANQPASLSHLRIGSRFCGDLCRKQFSRAA
jgi:hypothetical protein